MRYIFGTSAARQRLPLPSPSPAPRPASLRREMSAPDLLVYGMASCPMRLENSFEKIAPFGPKNDFSVKSASESPFSSIIIFHTDEYKGFWFRFRKFGKRPFLPFANSLITMDPLLIKFYQTSYQILTKVYLGRI